MRTVRICNTAVIALQYRRHRLAARLLSARLPPGHQATRSPRARAFGFPRFVTSSLTDPLTAPSGVGRAPPEPAVLGRTAPAGTFSSSGRKHWPVYDPGWAAT